MDTSRLARWHLVYGLLFAILGMCLGIYMAASQNHVQHVTHAHLLLVGFVVSIVYAVIYRLWVPRSRAILAVTQTALHQCSVPILGGGLFLLYGNIVPGPAIEPFLAVGSLAVLVALILMGVQVLGTKPATQGSAATAQAAAASAG